MFARAPQPAGVEASRRDTSTHLERDAKVEAGAWHKRVLGDARPPPAGLAQTGLHAVACKRPTFHRGRSRIFLDSLLISVIFIKHSHSGKFLRNFRC